MIQASDDEHLKCLEQLAKLSRLNGRSIVLTTGVWDVLHSGHIRYLEDAARLGDELFVGVDSDWLVQKAKGPGRPILGQEERCSVVGALRDVRLSFVFDSLIAVMNVMRPDILVVSPTTQLRQDWLWDRASLARDTGAKIVVVPSRSQTHTTDIVQIILERFGPK